MMPRSVYEQFVKGYTEKQWGVPAANLSASLAGRFDVRNDGDVRLKRHRHQGIPVEGYAVFMRNLLDGIPAILNFDYVLHREVVQARVLLVFTGPIDVFLNQEFGRLAYRGQRREHDYHPNVAYVQPCGQVNNPDPGSGPHVRTLEWKHMMPAQYASRIKGTVVTREIPITPSDPDQYEYPFPDEDNARRYALYAERARALERTLICGRLGEYRYYDMDQAIAHAFTLVRKHIGLTPPGPRSDVTGPSRELPVSRGTA